MSNKSLEEKVGYLSARVEDCISAIEKMQDTQKEILEQISVTKGFIKGFKIMSLIVIAIITFKFGDIMKVWGKF